MKRAFFDNKPLPFVEGIVEESCVMNLSIDSLLKKNDDPHTNCLVLKINSLKHRCMVPYANYRIDKGERVVLYSYLQFYPPAAESYCQVCALQVMGEAGKVKFTGIHSNGVEFREQ